MKKILPFLLVINLAACIKTVHVKIPSKRVPIPPVLGYDGIREAYKKICNHCENDLQRCQAQIEKWQIQCASKDAELSAIENPK